jgi:hypothetical protein
VASLTGTYVSSGLGLAVLVLGEARQRALDGRRQDRPPAVARLRAALDPLFPVTPEDEPAGPFRPHRPGRRALSVAIQAGAVCVAAGLLLLRVARVPAWNCAYAEDWGIFLVYAWQHPWHLFVPYNGYEQLLPRLLGQVASMVPVQDVAVCYAVSGALIAACCALFVYHASAGFIRLRLLRVTLAAAVVLLPVAPLEIVANGVNTPWYLMAAFFWAALWRPRSRGGMAVAALIAFLTAASVPTVVAFLPVLAIRLVVLPRLREHAVTAGWLAGLAVQVPEIADSYATHTQRLGGALAPPSKVLAYYLHTVVLRAIGWHLSWHLQAIAGRSGATLIVGAFLLIVLGWAAITQGPQVRLFTAWAVLGGFVLMVASTAITSYLVKFPPVLSPVSFEGGSRYTVTPILALTAAATVAVDAYVRRGIARRPSLDAVSPRAVCAVAALVLVLALGWVTDFRYVTQRTTDGPWRPVAQSLLTRCEHSSTGTITVDAWYDNHAIVSCSRLHG